MNNTNQKNNTKPQTTDNPMMITEAELNITNIFNKKSAFDFAARMADAFSKSTIVPKDYQGNPSNCLIALEMANRIGTSPMMVMQNLYIISGRPAWSSQFIIAMINNSKKYKTELQYDLKGEGTNMECTAFAVDHNNRKIVGPKITMTIAEQEGWLGKNGSKWKTMPEVMIRYRAASFFGRLHCPDLIMGIYSADEVIDISESDYRYVEPIPTETIVETADVDFHVPTTKVGVESEIADEPTNEILDSDSDDVDSAKSSNIAENTVEESNKDTDLSCSDCGVVILQAEKTFSIKHYGRELCRNCQKTAVKE